MAWLWDGSTGEHVSTLKGHSGLIYSVALSPNSCQSVPQLSGILKPYAMLVKHQWHISTGAEDETVRLWDGSTGEHVLTLEGHSGLIYSVALSPNSCRSVPQSSGILKPYATPVKHQWHISTWTSGMPANNPYVTYSLPFSRSFLLI